MELGRITITIIAVGLYLRRSDDVPFAMTVVFTITARNAAAPVNFMVSCNEQKAKQRYKRIFRFCLLVLLSNDTNDASASVR